MDGRRKGVGKMAGSAIRVSQEDWKGTAKEKGNVRRFEEGIYRRSVVRCANVDGGRGCAFDGPRSFGPGFRGHQSVRQFRLMRFALRRAAMCTTASPTVSAT